MPLATTDEMLKWASEVSGISIEDLRAEIERQIKTLKKSVTSDRLMYWSILSNMGYQPPLPKSIIDNTLTIIELKDSKIERDLNTEGFLVSQWEFDKGKGKRTGFVIMDKTGGITGFITFLEHRKKWEELNPVLGDFLQFEKISLWGNNKNLSLADNTVITKIEKLQYTLDDIPITDIKDLEVDEYAKIQGSIVGTPYELPDSRDISVKFSDGYSDTRIKIRSSTMDQYPASILEDPILVLFGRYVEFKGKYFDVSMIKQVQMPKTKKLVSKRKSKKGEEGDEKQPKGLDEFKEEQKEDESGEISADLYEEIQNIIVAFEKIDREGLYKELYEMFQVGRKDIIPVLGKLVEDKKIVIGSSGLITMSIFSGKG